MRQLAELPKLLSLDNILVQIARKEAVIIGWQKQFRFLSILGPADRFCTARLTQAHTLDY